LARQYEASGGISFRGFVDELRVAAETAQAAEAPILEEGSDGVRIMTVHKAKGLEFPVVVLADPTCKLSPAEASRWLAPDKRLCALKLAGWAPIDLVLHGEEERAREQAEAVRLAYVAATRARDLLVVPVIGDGAYDGGWLDPLTAAVYPAESGRREPARAAGCPAFPSKDSVMNRPDGDPARPYTVAPGAFEFRSGQPRTTNREPRTANDYAVVWWDPHLLHLGAVSTFGLRRDDLIVKDGDLFAVEERMADYERWQRDRAETIERAGQPTLRVQTATAWAAAVAELGLDDEIAAASSIEIVEIAGAERRPRGPRFGTLVHALLATVALDASADDVVSTAETQGRLLLSTMEEIRAAAAVATAVLQHDLMARARQAPMLTRETPVTWLQKDGTMIEGVLDLAFAEGGVTVIVDFKTDHELAAGESRYRAQVQQYVSAVERATGRPAKGILFKI
jgi:ATP-dependent exoDNAse (exonuclease V) beta subunit